MTTIATSPPTGNAATGPTPPWRRWPLRVLPPGLLGAKRARTLIERNYRVSQNNWAAVIGGLFEPIFFLTSIGVGIGKLVGHVHGGGHTVTYPQYVAPGFMAAAAMNGAIYESFNIFHKLKYAKTYEAILATPLGVGDIAVGEIGWSLLRGAFYAATFLMVILVAGLTSSWWAFAVVPAAVLIGFAFAAIGIAAVSYMKTWQDFDLIQMGIVPLFLFSATFAPLRTYPEVVQWLVRVTPLYHGVTMLRDLLLDSVGWTTLGHAAYLVATGALGLWIAKRRLGRLLLV